MSLFSRAYQCMQNPATLNVINIASASQDHLHVVLFMTKKL